MRLFVGNVPYGLDETGLAQAFEAVGVTVTNPKILRDRETGQPRGFGFVDIDAASDLARVQEARIEVMGRTLRIEMAQQQEDRRPSRPPRERRFEPEPATTGDGRGNGHRRKPDRPGRGRRRGRDRDFGDRW